MDGYAPVGADPEEEEVSEEAGHGLANPEPRVHPKVETVVLWGVIQSRREISWLQFSLLSYL